MAQTCRSEQQNSVERDTVPRSELGTIPHHHNLKYRESDHYKLWKACSKIVQNFIVIPVNAVESSAIATLQEVASSTLFKIVAPR